MLADTRPILSVIVPVYNVEDTLSKCVDSILDQPFRDLELILVDDGSPDRSGTMCDEIAFRDSRVVVVHKPMAVSALHETQVWISHEVNLFRSWTVTTGCHRIFMSRISTY